MNSLKAKGNMRRCRKGVSTVEFAITLPVLAILVFGSIETSHSIQLKQGLTITAYETVMTATTQAASESQARQRANQIAAAFGIKDVNITFTPAIKSDLPAGTTVTVNVSAPISSNRCGPNFFFTNRVLTVRASMVRL